MEPGELSKTLQTFKKTLGQLEREILMWEEFQNKREVELGLRELEVMNREMDESMVGPNMRSINTLAEEILERTQGYRRSK